MKTKPVRAVTKENTTDVSETPKREETPLVRHRPDEEVHALAERLSRRSPKTWKALAK